MELRVHKPNPVGKKKKNKEQIGLIENKQQGDKHTSNHTYVETYQCVHFEGI